MISNEVMQLTGLSKERIAQYAKRNGVKKVGRMYMWEESEVAGLVGRIGKKGKRLDRS